MLARSKTATDNRKWLEKMAREADRQRARVLRERLREARARKRQAKADARATCMQARQGVREWVANERAVLKAKIAKLREVTQAGCRVGRERVEETHGVAVRQALGQLETQRETARLIRMAKGGRVSAKLPRAASRARAAEKRSESEHEILAQLDTEQQIVWGAVKSRIKGNAYASRLEVFQHWLTENANEVARILTQHYERNIDRLVAEEERARAEMFDYRSATKRQLAARIERAARFAESDAGKRKPRPVRAPGVLTPPKKKPRGKIRPKKKPEPGTALALAGSTAKPKKPRRTKAKKAAPAPQTPGQRLRAERERHAEMRTPNFILGVELSRRPATLAQLVPGTVVKAYRRFDARGKLVGGDFDPLIVTGIRARKKAPVELTDAKGIVEFADVADVEVIKRVSPKARPVARGKIRPKRGTSKKAAKPSTAIVLASAASPKAKRKRKSEPKRVNTRPGSGVIVTKELHNAANTPPTLEPGARCVVVRTSTPVGSRRPVVEVRDVGGETWFAPLDALGPDQAPPRRTRRIPREPAGKLAKKPRGALKVKRASKAKKRATVKLKSGSSREVVSANIRAERAAGVAQKQAVAIALSKAGRSRKPRAVGARAGVRAKSRKPAGKVRPKKTKPGTAITLASATKAKKSAKGAQASPVRAGDIARVRGSKLRGGQAWDVQVVVGDRARIVNQEGTRMVVPVAKLERLAPEQARIGEPGIAQEPSETAPATARRATKKKAAAPSLKIKVPSWPKSDVGYVLRATALDGVLVVDAYVDRGGRHTRTTDATHSSPSFTFEGPGATSEAALARLALDSANYALAFKKERGVITTFEKPQLTIKRGARPAEPWSGRLPPPHPKTQKRMEAHPVASRSPKQKGKLRNLRKRERFAERQPLKRARKAPASEEPNAYERRQRAKKERLTARAQKVRAEADQTAARTRQIAAIIPMGQPVLVGHHSEGRHRRDLARIRSGYEKSEKLAKQAGRLERRAQKLGEGGIASDDPQAVAKLREKLKELEASRAMMKRANDIARKRGMEAALKDADPTARKAIEHNLRYSPGGTKKPFPSYVLSNANAEIRRVLKRIEQLSKLQEAGDRRVEGEGWRIYEDAEAGRIYIEFDERQPKERTELLRGRGWRWTPTAKAWTRKRTDNAWSNANYLARDWPRAKVEAPAKRPRKRAPMKRQAGVAPRRPAGRVQFTGAARRASAEGRQFGELLRLRRDAYDPGGGLTPAGSLVSFQRVVASVEGVGDVVQVLTDDGERLELPMSTLSVIRAQSAPAPF